MKDGRIIGQKTTKTSILTNNNEEQMGPKSGGKKKQTRFLDKTWKKETTFGQKL